MITEKEIKKSDKKIDLSGFKMRDELNSKIWDKGQKIKPEVRKALLKIADDYFEGLDLPNIDIEDITMTGSLANYNWSKYSDVDLHIVIDYKDMPMDEELIQDFLKSKSSSWNDQHDIKIYGFDVELYVQDLNEEHVSSGVYSLLKNEWNVKPEKKKITIKDKSVKDKSNRVMDMIEGLYDKMQETDDFEHIVELADKIKDKIKKMRQCGLDKGGEFSVENMVFKVLRRNGMLERLNDIKTVAYDKSVTLESINENDEIDIDWIENVNPYKEIDDYYSRNENPLKTMLRDYETLMMGEGMKYKIMDRIKPAVNISEEEFYKVLKKYLKNKIPKYRRILKLITPKSSLSRATDYFIDYISNLQESEEIGLEWIEDIEPISPKLPFYGYEYWVDTSMLTSKEYNTLRNYILRYVEGTESNPKPLYDKKYNGIVVHCGTEDHEYIPVEGELCYMPTTFDEDDLKENSLYVDGSILLYQYKFMDK